MDWIVIWIDEYSEILKIIRISDEMILMRLSTNMSEALYKTKNIFNKYSWMN